MCKKASKKPQLKAGTANTSITYAELITIKSIMFHTLRRYEFGCKSRPSARILHAASTQKIPKKYGSACSNWMANGVRSPSGKCSSMAITTHVDMIVMSTVYSNSGHSIIYLNRRRMRLLWPRINNDDGPGGGSTFIDALLADDDGTTFTFTFCPEFVVVAVICVSTLAPIDASFIAVLLVLGLAKRERKIQIAINIRYSHKILVRVWISIYRHITTILYWF